MSKTNRINIDSSLYLATKDFKIVGDIDYEKFGAGRCTEGHPIRYGIEVDDGEGQIFIFGNTCIYKPFVLKHWELDEDKLEDPNVAKAGRNLYIIARDNLADYIEDIPHPKDLDWNFEKLNNILKKIVKDAKIKKNTHMKQLKREVAFKKQLEHFKQACPEQFDLLKQLKDKLNRLKENKMLGILSKWDKEFIISINNQHKDFRVLTDKQLDVIKRLIELNENKEEFTKLKSEASDLITKATKNLESFNKNTIEFILSLQRQFFKKGSLSERQIEVLKNIVNMEFKISTFIGKTVMSWVIEKNFGIIGQTGKVMSVEVVRPKAIKGVFRVGEVNFEGWVPISTLVD